MKKLIALALAVLMVMSMAACAGQTDDKDTTADTTQQTNDLPLAASPLEALQTIWDLYGEDERFFVMGGDFDAMVDGAPGAVNVSNTDFLGFNLLVPEDQLANVSDAACMIHAMNANTFTLSAFSVADAAAFATAMQTAIQNNHWMCGFPEKLVIADLQGVVVVAFGINDTMSTFQTHLNTAYAGAQILVDEAIAG